MTLFSAPISRRNLLRLARAFGWSSLLLALESSSAPMNLSRLAHAAETIHKTRQARNARARLTYAITISGESLFQINGFGYLIFLRDIEARTDGAIRIEFIPGGELCNELTCAKKAMQGIVDIYSSSIQNAAGAAFYFNALNFPYLFPSRAAQHHFFYHPKSVPLLREPLRRRHGLELLFTSCRLRGLVMGQKWRDKPDITSIEELAGARIRATASEFGQTALRLLNIDPIPLGWKETVNAMRFGLVDGMETWESAAAGMATQNDIISQVLDVKLFSGNTHAAMRADVFDSLTLELQEAVLESAYFTQIWGQLAGEASLIDMVGASTPQKPDTIFAKNDIRYIRLPDTEIAKMEQMCSPEFNPQPWQKWRERLNKMAGGRDVWRQIYDIAREIPPNTLVENIPAQRWWKA